MKSLHEGLTALVAKVFPIFGAPVPTSDELLDKYENMMYNYKNAFDEDTLYKQELVVVISALESAGYAPPTSDHGRVLALYIMHLAVETDLPATVMAKCYNAALQQPGCGTHSDVNAFMVKLEDMADKLSDVLLP